MTEQLRELIIKKLVDLCPFVDDCKKQCTPADQENCWGVHANQITPLKVDKGVSFPVNIKHIQIIPFAKAMDEVLCKNDSKGGWRDCTKTYLQHRLIEELGEYFELLAKSDNIEFIKNNELERKELVDIANFILMLWDRS